MALQPEQAEHINIVNWFNYQFPALADDLHHFANERACSIQQGRILKRMGVKRGVPDFFLAVPLDGYAGFWLELKVGKNKVTPEQQAFLNRKAELGYRCAACWGFDAAKELILNYLKKYETNRTSNIPKTLYKNAPIC